MAFFVPAALGSPAACPVPDGSVISSLAFDGLRHTRPSVVRAALGHRAGAPFVCKTWEQERNRLKDLDIFAEVALEANARGDSAALTYRFRELPPYVPFVAVNKTDQDGFSAGPALASLNFLGQALRVEAMARFGGTTEYQASVSGRQLFGRRAEFDLAWIRVDSYNRFLRFHEDSHRFKADLYWPLAGRWWAGGFGEFFSVDADTADITLRPDGDFVPRAGAGLRYDARDRALLPRRGFFSEVRWMQNGGWLGGPADYGEWLYDGRGYVPMGRRFGGTAGLLIRYRDDATLGRYDHAHLGGANTLRGYSDNHFSGPGDGLFNLESRFDLITERLQPLGPWSLNYALQAVAGFDAAGILEPGGDSIPFGSSFYVGLHLLIPGLERVRLEFGMPWDGSDFRVHLGLFEKTTAQRFRTR